MTHHNTGIWSRVKDKLSHVAHGPVMLACLPALTLATYWLGGETSLMVLAIGLPVFFACFGLFSSFSVQPLLQDHLGGVLSPENFRTHVKDVFDRTNGSGLKSALMVLEIDEYKTLVATHGESAADAVVQRTSDRIGSTLRQRDTLSKIGDGRFAVCLNPIAQIDLESSLQLAGRVQAAIEEPISIGGMSVFISSSLGVCLRHRSPGSTAVDWMDAAANALEEAKVIAPGGIRVFSKDTVTEGYNYTDLQDEMAHALETGMIKAWFQPQVDTDTGRVSGFEALARWEHPVRGMVPPASFLPALEAAGLMQKLSKHMTEQALTALKSWDAAGLKIPCVGVNFASDELRDPGLVDRIRWDLERFGMTPDRLCIEVLETVMTDTPDDMVSRNIAALGELGCRIDLDDFGTGHASIASVRRFRVGRIKIDRSFVTHADHDPDQQKLIAAILTMAERLDLDTLAEGVETVGEHALLAQLGCGHVQGFGIGRPMPFKQTLDWVVAHEAKLQDAPEIGTHRS